MTPQLSVVVPLYNEAAHLDRVVAAVTPVLARCSSTFELILVDDGSRDGTWQAIQSLTTKQPEIQGIRLSRNFGKESALAAGLDAARGEAIVVMDGDLQHPPEVIEEMIAIWRQGDVDLIEAVKQTRGREPIWLRWGAGLFYKLYGRLGGERLEGATDFKLMDRRVLEAWHSLGERNVFFRGMAAWLGFRRRQVTFAVPERVGGHSRWRFWQLLRLALTGITSFSSLPLQLTTFIGFLFLLFSVLMGGHTLYMKFSGQAVSGFATVILLLLIMGSAILISLGIIGMYIARIYDEVKGRPRYLVADQTHKEQ